MQQRDKERASQGEIKEDIISWFSALKQPARGALRLDQHLIVSQSKRIVHSIMSIDELLGTKWSKTGGATLSPAS